MVSRRRQRAASAANPKAHAQSSRPPPPGAHARLNQSAPSAKAGRLGCEPAGMLCQHGGSAAGTWRRTPPMYTGRCIAICHAARLKTRQAPSHAGWRILVVYIFPRKHDINRKKLDLGTRHPRPTFAPRCTTSPRYKKSAKTAPTMLSARNVVITAPKTYPAARARYNASTRVYDGARFNPPLCPA